MGWMMNRKVVLIMIITIIALILVVEGAASFLYRQRSTGDSDVAATSSDLNVLRTKNGTLRKKMTGFAPRGNYIVVDTARNLLYLRNSDDVLLQAIISSGSGNILRDPKGERQWVFDTPRGEFMIQRKIVDPNWIKPDWAFIEEGEDIPKEWKNRVQEDVLGDYAMAFGNGYFIHGTLYTRLLGRNVTHGCIRVNDKDLESVYKKSRIGMKLYIF